MKILLCTPFRYPEVGGSRTHLLMLSKALLNLGHQVSILSLSTLPRWIRILTLSGPRVVLDRIARGWGIIWFYEVISLCYRILLRVWFRKEMFDVINVQHVALVRAVRKTASRHGIPVVLTVHGDCTNEQLSEGRIIADSLAEKHHLWLEREFYARADRVVTVDTRLRGHVARFVPNPADIRVIKNFIDTEIFSPHRDRDGIMVRRKFGIPPESRIILCPRRLVRKNGVVNAVKAFDWVLQNRPMPNLYLVYAGDGHLRPEIERFSQAHKMGRQVILLGSVKHSEISSLYSIADVVVIPSIRSAGVEEATSISALEAMSSGVPVIVSSIGGLRELVQHETNGLLVTEGDHRGLGEAIVRILTDGKMRDDLSGGARDTVLRGHSHIYGAQQFLQVYGEVSEVKK